MRTINKEKILNSLGEVVVLLGGQLDEREVSLKSGAAVFDSLNRIGVSVSMIDVGPAIVNDLVTSNPDMVVNMLHGEGGEDGSIQGLLEQLDLPYTGSGVTASALAMDKAISKRVWRDVGLKTPDFVILKEESDWEDIISYLGAIIVKPTLDGSSLGLMPAATAEELEQIFSDKRLGKKEIMAESRIRGTEYTVPILGSEIFTIIEFLEKDCVFDFQRKYGAQEIPIRCPAKLSSDAEFELTEMVRCAYDSLGCRGLARVDVISDTSGVFYLLEVNTIPGMTTKSFVPKSAQAIDVSFDDLMLLILSDCMEFYNESI